MKRMWVRRVLMLLITIALLVLVVRIVGVQALLEGGRVVTPLTILAALFLNEFVGDVPWGHIDIAPTMEVASDDLWRSTGSTGFGARLLAELAAAFVAPAAAEGPQASEMN